MYKMKRLQIFIKILPTCYIMLVILNLFNKYCNYSTKGVKCSQFKSFLRNTCVCEICRSNRRMTSLYFGRCSLRATILWESDILLSIFVHTMLRNLYQIAKFCREVFTTSNQKFFSQFKPHHPHDWTTGRWVICHYMPSW